ncbi:hypothetical protein GAYE_SCF17G3766 [Galdieria yellowstonensis]|uniref:Uncharacterized protein n=1 Tax=Galdieria yellowstonensis TaxID=3028027 RepID=A0AAV9IES9_9RHOD|nr:hypothetical protein GAYE_SCF17G3766 [Galdieria yellowstonensis]
MFVHLPCSCTSRPRFLLRTSVKSTHQSHYYWNIGSAWRRKSLHSDRKWLHVQCNAQDEKSSSESEASSKWQPSLTERINPIEHGDVLNEMFWEAKKQVEAARRGERMSGEESIERFHQKAAALSVKKKPPAPKNIYLLSRSERRWRRLKKRISIFFSGLFAPIVDWHSVLRNRIREIGLVEWGPPKQPTPCNECYSFGFRPCPYCNMLGVRYTLSRRGKATCIHCFGLGWQTCPHCRGHQPETWMQDIYL